MLQRLRIKNFALIEKSELRFSPGLNVFSGETGAGKSILLGALSAVLGERITPELYRSNEDELEVEASLDTEGLQLPQWVENDEGLIIILRKSVKSKRPQNFVNQQQTTQAALQELGDVLVDIHGQHQHQLLLKVSTHADFLDAYGGLLKLRSRFASQLEAYNQLCSRLKELTDDLARRRKERDFTEFQLAEIDELNPKQGETEELEKEQALLASAEKRAEMTSRLIEIISEQDGSILEGVAIAKQILKELTVLDDNLESGLRSLKEVEVGAEETWRNLVKYRETIEYSPQRLEEINERLFKLEKLGRKHDTDEAGLVDLAEELKQRLDSIDLDAEEIVKLEAEKVKSEKEVKGLAAELSQGRKEASDKFIQAVEKQLDGLAMPRTRLVVEFIRKEEPQGLYEENGKRYRLTDRGLEEIIFLFSANPGEEPKPLAKIASGGELSRIMLALKTVLVDTDQVPVLVFDEIDVGIGGSTAETVGRRLKELACKKQILLVTHLHQIARYADAHFRVTKEVKRGRTYTLIKRLNEEERVDEIARMLGGEEITETVRAHARELIEGQ